MEAALVQEIEGEVVEESTYPATSAPQAVTLPASVEIEARRAACEVQASVLAAKSCPRDERRAKQKLIESCKDFSFANLAFYAVKRGTDVVEGASIELAKEVARTWGNMQYSVIDHGPIRQEKCTASQLEVQVWDVENNTRYNKRFTVPHWQNTKNGGYAVNDLNRVSDIVSARTSKEVRKGILSFVPRALVNELKLICDATRLAGSPSDIAAALEAAINYFDSKNISLDQIEAHFGIARAEFGAVELDRLRQICDAVEAGEDVDGFFEIATTKPEANTGRKSKRGKLQLKPEVQQAVSEAQAPQQEEQAPPATPQQETSTPNAPW